MSILLSRGIIYDHDITDHMDASFYYILLYLACFVVSICVIYSWVLLDSNGLCKFSKIFIYKITEAIQ